MYLTTDLETDETIAAPKPSKILDRLLGIKIETNEDLENMSEADEEEENLTLLNRRKLEHSDWARR